MGVLQGESINDCTTNPGLDRKCGHRKANQCIRIHDRFRHCVTSPSINSSLRPFDCDLFVNRNSRTERVCTLSHIDRVARCSGSPYGALNRIKRIRTERQAGHRTAIGGAVPSHCITGVEPDRALVVGYGVVRSVIDVERRQQRSHLKAFAGEAELAGPEVHRAAGLLGTQGSSWVLVDVPQSVEPVSPLHKMSFTNDVW